MLKGELQRCDAAKHPLGRTILSILCLVGTLSAITSSAEGSALSKKKKEAKRIAARIESTGNKIEQIQEDYLVSKLRLEKLKKKLAVSTADSSKTELKLTDVRAQLRKRALETVAAPVDETTLRDSEDLGAFERRSALSQLAGATSVDLEDSLRANLEDLERKKKQVAVAREDAEATTKLLAKQKREADALLVDLESLQKETQGELKGLIAEAERQAAEAEAAAQRKAIENRRKAAAAELARRRTGLRDRLKRGVNSGAAGRGQGDIPQIPSQSEADQPSSRRNNQPRARVLPVEDAPDDALVADAGELPAAPVSRSAGGAVELALAQVGKPYVWGADGPGSFDCSGLMLYAWRAAGKSLPHSSRAQYSSTTRVSVSQIEAGDLVFYGSPIHHVGMYIGNGNMVEASHAGVPVRIRSIFRRDMVGVGRVG